MAQDGTEKDGGINNPYSFDAGEPFFKTGRSGNQIEGTFTEIRDVDPAAELGASGTINGNASGSSGNGFSAASIGAAADGGKSGQRKRGRPRGSSKATDQDGIAAFADAIFAIHLGMAAIVKCPELELDKDEAEKVTVALDRLLAHHNLQPPEGAKIWMRFAGTMTAVYGPRIIAIKSRIDSQNDPSKKVVDIRTGQPVV